MILSGPSIRACAPLDPIVEKTIHPETGTSFGLSLCGYDIRIRERVALNRGGFALTSTLERFDMPNQIMGVVHDKSTWARRGLAVQNTVIEPGWRGYLTLELTAHLSGLEIPAGAPIAQIIFHQIDRPTAGYAGKYQDQPARPVAAIAEVA
ncbi:MAG: dCTP deaminase [Pseudomonadota bacterium]